MRAPRRSDHPARQNALVTAGWTVIRTNWYELTEEPETLLAVLRAALTSTIAD